MRNAQNGTRKSIRKEKHQDTMEEIRENKILDIWNRRNSMYTHPIPAIDDVMVIPTNP